MTRIRRTLWLAVGATLAVLGLYVLFGFSTEVWGQDPSARKAAWPLWRLNMALAYTALGLLCAALLIGPIRVLRGGRPSVHTALRRDVGLWAGGVAIMHMVIGAIVHTEGWAVWTLWLWDLPRPGDWWTVRLDAFGLSNLLGLFQASLLAGLMVISNDRTLATLGAPRWKRLQRLTYVALASILVHGLLYQTVEDRDWTVRAVFGVLMGLTIALQASAIVRQWRKRRRLTDSTDGNG
jgi:sulfoxide reductase heme-binding subunit YedZ